MKNIIRLVEDFIYYGEKTLGLFPYDGIEARNKIYYELGIYPNAYYKYKKATKIYNVDYFVANFSEYFKKQKLDDLTLRIKMARLFDIISPSASDVIKRYYRIAKVSKRRAASYLYNLGVNNHYIHLRAVKQNIEWKAEFLHKHYLEITINLSKPEKSTADIAKLVQHPQSDNYPKCALCIENLGFFGDNKRPQRQTLRIVPFSLCGERWFMQFSPYGYFNEHMILISFRHANMEISPRIFKIMMAALKEVPFYTVTCNADLPIVGGSILNHEHFQCGDHVFPVQKAIDLYPIKTTKHKDVKASVVNFYNSVIRLVSNNPDHIIECCNEIFKKWIRFNAPEIDIVSHTKGVRHNTITPIFRIRDDKKYEATLILRNNRKSAKYPDGIFHAHPKYFHIKKENIGVIEAMGRFILPGRLKEQMEMATQAVKAGLTKKSQYLKKYPKLQGFDRMIRYMSKNHMTAKDYINGVCRSILINTAVFKRDPLGNKHFKRFVKSLKL